MAAAHRPETADRAQGRSRRSVGTAPRFDYVATAGVPDAVESYARAKVARLYRLAPERILSARVTMTRLAGRSTGRHVAAQGALDVGGHVLHAAVEAVDAYEAVDLLQQRLRDQVVRLNGRRRAHGVATIRGRGGDAGAPRE